MVRFWKGKKHGVQQKIHLVAVSKMTCGKGHGREGRWGGPAVRQWWSCPGRCERAKAGPVRGAAEWERGNGRRKSSPGFQAWRTNHQACNHWKEKPVFGFRHLRGNSQAVETIEPGLQLKCRARERKFTFVVQKFLRDESAERPEHGGPSLWGKPWPGAWWAGARSASLAGRRRWTHAERHVLQNLKRMVFEMHAFACQIIRGDSTLGGVEQFWKLDYNI